MSQPNFATGANAEFAFDLGGVPDFAWTAEAGFEYNLDAVGGPLYLRGVILDQDFPPGYAERLTDAVLRALGAT